MRKFKPEWNPNIIDFGKAMTGRCSIKHMPSCVCEGDEYEEANVAK